MMHNGSISDEIRDQNAAFNKDWIEGHGLVGAGAVATRDLDVDEDKKRDASPFMVVWLKNIDRLCGMLGDAFEYRAHTLIDVGCGSGISTLYFNQKHDFKSVKGFDFSRNLIDLANTNKQLMTEAGRDVSTVSFEVADATTFQVPNDPLIIFMFNPFGWETMRAFVENNIEALRRTNSIILYANDLHIGEISSYGNIIKRDDFYNISAIQFSN